MKRTVAEGGTVLGTHATQYLMYDVHHVHAKVTKKLENFGG